MTRVISYNILAGGYSSRKENVRRTQQLVCIMRSAQPDIIGVVEATHPGMPEHPWVIEEIAEQLGMQLVLPENAASPIPNKQYQTALLTRLPIVYQRTHRHPAMHRPLLEVCVEEASGHTLTAFVTHLSATFSAYRAGDSIRLREVREIVRIMAPQREQAQLHLLMGDFNSLAPNDAFTASALLRYIVQLDAKRRTRDIGDGNPSLDYVVPPRLRFLYPLLQAIAQSQLLSGLFDAVASLYDPRNTIRFLRNAGYVDCYRSLHPQARGFTCPAALPAGRIDYIFADSLLARRLGDCYVINEVDGADGLPGRDASDHLAVAATYAPVAPVAPIPAHSQEHAPISAAVGAS